MSTDEPLKLTDWISPAIGYLTLCPGLPVPRD
jgi:hypothetical protein